MSVKGSPCMFGPEELRAEIVGQWGPAGAHVEVFDDLLRRVEVAERRYTDMAKRGTWKKAQEYSEYWRLVAEKAERKLEQSSQALLDVIAERRRQMEVEGWSPAHDDEHTDKSLADAAACYLLYESPELVPKRWPWDPTWWKPKDYRRNCVRAAALVIAEIERVDRAAIDAKKWKR